MASVLSACLAPTNPATRKWRAKCSSVPIGSPPRCRASRGSKNQCCITGRRCCRFRLGGVTDQAARLPAAFDAALLIAAIYFFLRRFRPGSELDGALITASCAGVVGFAHAAATDMPLAAAFAIALLAWYAWYESRRQIYLAAFYIFLALGTLAKGPVAPALSAVIILLFVAVKRDWRAIPRTLWIPGIALYLAVMLPWYIAVQLRNPEFFRVFILEHNLARFSQDVYHHRQPFWFYLPVFLLAMMPWTLVLILARRRTRSPDLVGGQRSFFQPGRFLAAVSSHLDARAHPVFQRIAIEAAGLHPARRPRCGAAGGRVSGRSAAAKRRRFSPLFAVAHGVLCGLLIFAALSAASIAMNHHLLWGTWNIRRRGHCRRVCAGHRRRACSHAPDFGCCAPSPCSPSSSAWLPSFVLPRPSSTPRNPRVPLPRPFRPFRTSRSPSRSIASIACRNTAWSFISIVRRRHTKAENPGRSSCPGCRTRYRIPSRPTCSRTPSVILNQYPRTEVGFVLGWKVGFKVSEFQGFKDLTLYSETSKL